MVKKIKAPKTYDPGKGRPKEHLAYLNEREMAYLRSINGNNMERGPKGLPSFPPSDAIGSSSVSRPTSSTMNNSPQSGGRGAGSNYGSGSGRPGTTPSSGGGGLGQGGQGSGSRGTSTPASGGSNLGQGGQRGAGSNYGPGSGRSSTTTAGASPTSPGGLRGAGSNYGYGSARPGTPAKMDSKVVQAAQVKDARQAVSSPALNRDLRVGGISTLSVGPIGTTVKVGKPVASGMSYTPAQEAGKISKSISAARAAQPGMVGPVAISSFAQPTGYSTTFNTQNQVNALRDVMQSQIGFGDQAFTSNPNETVRHLAGEVGTSGVGAGQVAQTMVNRSLVSNDPSLPQYDNNLANREQWASIGNPAYNAAAPGSAVAGQVANQAIKEMMSGVPVPNATDFRAVNQPGGVKTQKVGTDVAGNRFGNFEGVSGSQIAALRGANLGASQYNIPSATVPLSSSPAPKPVSIAAREAPNLPSRVSPDAGFVTRVSSAINSLVGARPAAAAEPTGPISPGTPTAIPGPNRVLGAPQPVTASVQAQQEALKNAVAQYTKNIPSLKEMAQAYASVQPYVNQYQTAALGSQWLADKAALSAGKYAGVDKSIASGIRALGGIVEGSVIGAMAGQAALARSGAVPPVRVDTQGPARAIETVNSAEGGKVYTDRVPGSPDSAPYTNPGTTQTFNVYAPTEEAAVYSEPAYRTTTAAIAGSQLYSDIGDVYRRATATPATTAMESSGEILGEGGYGYPVKNDGTPVTAEDLRNMPQDIQSEYLDKTMYARKYDTPYPLTKAQKEKAIAANVATAPIRFGPLGTIARGLSLLPGPVGAAAGAIYDPGETVSDYDRANPLRRQQIADRIQRQNESIYGLGGGRDTSEPQPIGGGGRREPREPTASVERGRPQIYYMWDVGVNIPSPGDPNYTLYQQYLAERDSAYG